IVYSVNNAAFHSFGSSVQIPVTSEGTTTVSWFAKDKAGNSEVAQTLTLKIDKTPPVFTNTSRTAPNLNGWNNTDVEASFTATDNLSGFDSGATETGTFLFSSEGAGKSHTFTVTDLAGNSTAATVTEVNIDKTAPVIGSVRNPMPNANGWNNTDVTVSFNGTDALSGIASVSGPTTVSTEGANQVVTGTATDLAGNVATASVTLNIDKSAPDLI